MVLRFITCSIEVCKPFFGHVSHLEIFVPFYRWDSVPTSVWDIDKNMLIDSDPTRFHIYSSNYLLFLSIHLHQQHTTWSTNNSPTCPSQISWPTAPSSLVSIYKPFSPSPCNRIDTVTQTTLLICKTFDPTSSDSPSLTPQVSALTTWSVVTLVVALYSSATVILLQMCTRACLIKLLWMFSGTTMIGRIIRNQPMLISRCWIVWKICQVNSWEYDGERELDGVSAFVWHSTVFDTMVAGIWKVASNGVCCRNMNICQMLGFIGGIFIIYLFALFLSLIISSVYPGR